MTRVIAARGDLWKSAVAPWLRHDVEQGRVPLPQGTGVGSGTPSRLSHRASGQDRSVGVAPVTFRDGGNWTIASTNVVPAAGLSTASACGQADSAAALDYPV
jgi:hypothetical protein